MVESLIGALVGGLLSFLATWLFYRRAAEDLREQASELRKLIVFVIRGLEEGGLAQFNRDAEGNIKGMVVNLSGHIKGSSNVSGNLQVIRREDAGQPEESGKGDREAEDRGGA